MEKTKLFLLAGALGISVNAAAQSIDQHQLRAGGLLPVNEHGNKK